MNKVRTASERTVRGLLEEWLAERGLRAIPDYDVARVVVGELKQSINSTMHLMTELGWRRDKDKWGGVGYARAIWVAEGCAVQGGDLIDPTGKREPLTEHLKTLDGEDASEVLYGQPKLAAVK